jgi:hypothetical protein
MNGDGQQKEARKEGSNAIDTPKKKIKTEAIESRTPE